jgi:hypothetical protein
VPAGSQILPCSRCDHPLLENKHLDTSKSEVSNRGWFLITGSLPHGQRQLAPKEIFHME